MKNGVDYDEEKALIKEAIKKIDGAISGKIDLDRDEYSIQTSVGRRQMKHIPMGDLIRLREMYARELQQIELAEKTAKGTLSTKRILVRLP